jgi:hypothetical protein
MLNEQEISKREARLVAVVEEALPELKKLSDNILESKVTHPAVLLHQDAYAVDYQDEEYLLLGMAIKYLGVRGVEEIRVIGKSRETLKNT